MKLFTRTLLAAAASLTLVVGFAACGDDGGGGGGDDTMTGDTSGDTSGGDTTPGDTTPGDTTPGDTAVGDTADDTGPGDVEDDTTPVEMTAVFFKVDDTANKVYGDRDLEWKGSFSYDEASNTITFDASWPGPYPPLFDDGPISAGGHEAEGEVAGDNILGIQVMIARPSADLTLEYGLQNKDGDWLWVGANGTVTIPAGAAGPIEATGLAFEPFGTIDMKLAMDTAAIADDFKPVTPGVTTIAVKGSAWNWAEVALTDDGTGADETAGDGIYTFRLSDNLPAGKGLLKIGDQPEFVWVVGGVEYKDGNSDAIAQGITAWTDWQTPGTFVEEEIFNLPPGAFGGNTAIVVGEFTPVVFKVDDTANKIYGDEDLEWKGSFAYDAATNRLTFDASWPGPYPPLYDDGPISAGGHEAEGEVAGDNILGVQVMVVTPAADLTLEYGLQNKAGDWLWVGANGTVTIPANDPGPVVATGLTFEAFGTIDMKLAMDTAAIDDDFKPVTPGVTTITVKGSAWNWAEVALTDDGMGADETAGDGVYTFQLSEHIPFGKGLLKLGDKPEFVWVVGGVEYKDGNSDAIPTGITAWTDWETPGTFVEETISNLPPGAFGGNTIIVVGDSDET